MTCFPTDQLLGVVLVGLVGLGGTRMLWQARLAAWNLGFVRMFDGNTEPCPEKFGFGSW